MVLPRRGGKWFSAKQFDQEPDHFEDQGYLVERAALVLFLVGDEITCSEDTEPGSRG